MALMTEPRDLALPTGYTDLLGELKNRVRAARTNALRTVNTQLIDLYWSIGRTTLERQAVMTGLSRSNLQYMRSFAEAWPAFDANVPQPVGHLLGPHPLHSGISGWGRKLGTGMPLRPSSTAGRGLSG
jgi:hypothetical protein